MSIHLKNDRHSYYGTVAVISAIVFAVIFSVIFIFGAFKLNENLDNHDKYPLEIDSNSLEMKKNLSNMEVALGRLTSDITAKNIKLVRKELTESKQEVAKNLACLDSYFLGPRQNATDIKKALEELYLKQESVLEMASKNA